MQYNLKVNDQAVTVDVETSDDGYTFSIGERSYTVSAHRMDSNEIWTLLNQKSQSLFVTSKGGAGEVSVQGVPFKVEDLARQRRRRGGADSGGGDIVPPMPGAIVRVLVEDGAAVTKGQEVIVMSAMKMETTLYAPADGTITKVLVAEGDQVMADQKLVEFEPATEA